MYQAARAIAAMVATPIAFSENNKLLSWRDTEAVFKSGILIWLAILGFSGNFNLRS